MVLFPKVILFFRAVMCQNTFAQLFLEFDRVYLSKVPLYVLDWLHLSQWRNVVSQPVITCSKLTIETLEQGVKICLKLTIKNNRTTPLASILQYLDAYNGNYLAILYQETPPRSGKNVFLYYRQWLHSTVRLIHFIPVLRFI